MPRWRFAWQRRADAPDLVDGYNLYLDQGEDTPPQRVGSTTGQVWELDVPAAPLRMRFLVAEIVRDVEADRDRWQGFEFRADATEDADAPATVAGFVVLQNGTSAVFQWEANAEPNIQAYEIRIGTDWSFARLVAVVAAPALSFVRGWECSGVSTKYLIKAWNRLGVESAAAASSTITFRADPYWLRVASHDEASFAGLTTNGEIVSSQLRPTALPAPTSTTPPYDTTGWDDGSTPPWWPCRGGTQYTAPYYDIGFVAWIMPELELTAPPHDLRGDPASCHVPIEPEYRPDGTPRTLGERYEGYQVACDGTLRDPVPLLVEIRTTPDNPAVSPVWTNWQRWIPGSEFKCRAWQMRLTWNTFWPFYSAKITTLKFHERRRNLKDEGVQNMDLGDALGTLITFNQPFTQAPSPSIAIKASNCTFELAAISSTSMRVKLNNPVTGARVTADVAWSAQGV